ncbi:sulfite exporter TauE/SafE family protein [Nitrosomonas sp. HPC101]|uniref:sulfite exporter TauE/SafE family protein n=1 Tax=Nitrosomonas sp. HPC101 TaxID=1658667 RepID=UPI001367EDCD|nr:sulfite exporter TauE/SafE family protein [Nitrosomonas sp. HPC101]MXS86543.1 sulfite exporter TauE/SafE family protein [Nitrosomonas sp. HPC101]
MEFIIYLLLGACAGVFAGLFGIGGGMIIVPILVYSFALQGFNPDVLTHMAVGTSLATIVFTSANSVRTHHKLGAVHWPMVLWMTIGIVVGSVLGAWTASSLSGPVLQKIIGIFAICMAVQMAFDLKPKASMGEPSKPALSAAGGVIGWASAIFGIGGGSLTVPFLTWRSVPIRQAVATSAACGMPIALLGAISFIITGWAAEGLPELSLGYVYLPALVGIALTSVFFAGFGARLAHRLPQRLLKRLFALMLVTVGINFLL